MSAFAQKNDTAKMVPVLINHARNYYEIKTDTGNFGKLIDEVILQQGTDILYCDSAYMNKTTHNFEAFGDVRITQADSTEAKSDYLKYYAGKKIAYMRGNVSLTDSKGKLWCDELTYNLGTKTGTYDKGGKLVSDSTIITSKTGEYNVNTKDAIFKGNAIITDPKYHIKSEHLLYNSESKITQFFAPSVITSDKMAVHTSSGTYDGHEGLANFSHHSFIWNDGQYIEGDTLNYNRKTGYGYARGHVVSIDTVHHSTIFCRHAEYYRKKKILWAVGDPVLQQVNGKDTFYMYADTFYSAPRIQIKTDSQLSTGQNTTEIRNTKGSKRAKKIPSVTGNKQEFVPTFSFTDNDTTKVDTTAPSFFTGYHHALIYSDSLQGKCDSISYTTWDSLIRMMYSPVAWSHNSQITGDTIILKLDSSSVKSIYVPNNAFSVSQSGPPRANLYDQVQGKQLRGYFKDNNINHLEVYPDAEAIYYPTDAKGAYIGVNQSKSDTIKAYFEDRKLKRIKLNVDPQITLTPMTKADFASMRLSRFKWLIDQRPKSKDELFKSGILEKAGTK